MSSSLFTAPSILQGQSFSHALAPLDPEAERSDEFIESRKLSLFADEQGTINVGETMLLYKRTDPIDGDVEHTYSPGNKFIAGLNKVITTIPTGGVIAYASGSRTGAPGSPPSGYGRCNGAVYNLSGGGTWTAPIIPDGFGGSGIIWIVKLPPGAVDSGARIQPPNIGN
jgi:hypothetical protein